jgi:hypothetical protein
VLINTKVPASEIFPGRGVRWVRYVQSESLKVTRLFLAGS